MDYQSALRARLIAAAPVNALVAGRVYWVDRPQASTLPAVTLQVISDERPQTHDGFTTSRATTVQVDCWGRTYSEKVAVAEAVINALVPAETSNGVRFLRSFVDSVRDLGERVETQFIHRTSVDLIVWHTTA
jgi:hypothetical protein